MDSASKKPSEESFSEWILISTEAEQAYAEDLRQQLERAGIPVDIRDHYSLFEHPWFRYKQVWVPKEYEARVKPVLDQETSGVSDKELEQMALSTPMPPSESQPEQTSETLPESSETSPEPVLELNPPLPQQPEIISSGSSLPWGAGILFLLFVLVLFIFFGVLRGHAAETGLNLLPADGREQAVFVDPEAPIDISTAAPTAAPANVRLPAVVAKKDEWRGVQCAVLQPRQAVFRHADKWEAYWIKGMAPFSRRFEQVPSVDFSKDMVIGVFMGEQARPFYEVEILSAKPLKQPDGTEHLVVRYKEISKMMGVFVPVFPVQPFHLKRVPVFTGPVVFERIGKSKS